MQFQADILDTQIDRAKVMETTALGAAYLAGIAVDLWKDFDEVAEQWDLDETFNPDMPEEQREDLYAGWQNAVEAARVFKHKPIRANRDEDAEV